MTIYVVEDSKSASVKALEKGGPVYAMIFGTVVVVSANGATRHISGAEWDALCAETLVGNVGLERA